MNLYLVKKAADLGIDKVTFVYDVKKAAAPAELRGGHICQAQFTNKAGLAIANGGSPEEALERLVGYVENHPLQEPAMGTVLQTEPGIYKLDEGVYLHVHVTPPAPDGQPASRLNIEVDA